MQRNSKYPGGNEKFGTKVHPYDNDPWYWTIADQTGANVNKFVMRGHPDFGDNYFNDTWISQKNVNQTCFVRYQINYKGITYLDEFKKPNIIPQFDY